MMSASEFSNMLRNSEYYDTKLKLRNFDYDELLEECTKVKLQNKDFDKQINEILEDRLELIRHIDQLELSLLALKKG